ncbi:MAG: type III-B CRISPR module RAMP protein Cmr6 [Kiritimatiellae bacterium]|nr:type III-B CRISPR module RAMP protein Cmr6 [Kiritimatiellia bacterium]
MRATVTNELAALLGGVDRLYPACESLSLRLEKFVRLGDNSTKDEIDAVVKCHRAHARPIPSFEPKGCATFVARLRSRLIVNQAGGILENAGLCLHPHFGSPYIPGSAVKGIARHAAWCEWKEAKDAGDDGQAAAVAERIAAVFGYPTGDKDGLDAFLAARGWKDKRTSGSVVFLAAAPVDAGRLATDIVNCHHPKYYAGNLPYAADNESPNPQFFPAVDEGVSFLFTIAPVRTGADMEAAKGWLVRAISENGAGAKTSAGYGWFDCNEKLTNDWRDRIDREKTRRELEAEKIGFVGRLELFKSMSNEELAKHDTEVHALDGELSRLSNKLEAAKMSGADFRNRYQPVINVLLSRLRKSPLEELRASWDAQRENVNQLVGNNIAAFLQLPDDRKELVCRLLWEPTGIGAEIRDLVKDEKNWPRLNNARRRSWRQGLNDLRTYAKQKLQMGKMP